MQKFSIHTHTDFSDGRNTIEEMISSAKEKGLEMYGISNHLSVHSNLNTFLPKQMSNSFDGLVDKWEKHFENIRKIAKPYDIEVKCGIEFDYFNDENWIKEFEKFKRQISCDYLVSGSHYVYNDDFSKVINLYEFNRFNITGVNVNNLMKNYWKNVIAAVKSGFFDVIAHFDLPKRFDFIDMNLHKDLQLELVDVLLNQKMPIEINTKHFRETNEYSPDINNIDRLLNVNHPICISDDAHDAEYIAYNFDVVGKYLKQSGYTGFWKPNF